MAMIWTIVCNKMWWEGFTAKLEANRFRYSRKHAGSEGQERNEKGFVRTLFVRLLSF